LPPQAKQNTKNSTHQTESEYQQDKQHARRRPIYNANRLYEYPRYKKAKAPSEKGAQPSAGHEP